MRFARFNLFVVVLQLAAFLLVQADLPISQTREARLAPDSGGCKMKCCCSTEKQAQGTCCCSSKRISTKPGCSLCSSGCGDHGQPSTAPIVIKFQVTVPVQAVVNVDDLTEQLIVSTIGDPHNICGKPPVPPPRFLASA